MRIISAIINLVPIYVLTFRENIPYIVACFLLARFHLLPVHIKVGILLIFSDIHYLRASQKQEFRSQRDRETKTDTKQLALARLNYPTFAR